MGTIMDAAKYLIYLSYNLKVRSLTPLKLQKILYLSQGGSYVWDDRELFLEEFEAWKYGPVNLEVYQYFKKYGSDEIPEWEGDKGFFLKEEERETLQVVWNSYSDQTASQLVSLTHRHRPWIMNYINGERVRISNEDIRDYFKEVY